MNRFPPKALRPARPGPHRRAAFTLVELLAVIAIIVVLASLLLPGISGMMERGESVRCMNNLRQWASAVMLYGQDREGRLPSASTSTGTVGGTQPPHVPKSIAWYDYGILNLGYSTNILKCRSQAGTNLRLLNNNPVRIQDNAQWPITGGTAGQYRHGYTCNSFWMDRDDEWQRGYRGQLMGAIPVPGKALMFGDGDGSAFGGGDPSTNFRYRHGPGSTLINVVMFDGRAESWPIERSRINGIFYLGQGGSNNAAPLFKNN